MPPVRAALPRRLLTAVLSGAVALGLAAAAMAWISPEPLRPGDPVRAAEMLADYNHKKTVAAGLLLLPLSALATVLLAAGAAEPGEKPGRWRSIAARWGVAPAVTLGSVVAMMVWDFDHPALSNAAWWSVQLRYGGLLLAQNVALAAVQSGVDALLQILRHLRRWNPAAAVAPAGWGTVAAVSLYAFCLTTIFTSRPWIAGRAPSEAMIEEHLDRYLAAVVAQEGAGSAQAPTFRAESRSQVAIALRAALNAEAVALTADLNPLVVGSSIWWHHDDGPPSRRVDLRTGSITYNVWIGSDSRITLPDFWRPTPGEGAMDLPRSSGAMAGAGDSGQNNAGPGSGENHRVRGPLAGIEIKTGFLGSLAGYGSLHLGPAGWGLGLQKEDTAPLAILIALAAGVFSGGAQWAASKLLRPIAASEPARTVAPKPAG